MAYILTQPSCTIILANSNLLSHPSWTCARLAYSTPSKTQQVGSELNLSQLVRRSNASTGIVRRLYNGANKCLLSNVSSGFTSWSNPDSICSFANKISELYTLDTGRWLYVRYGEGDFFGSDNWVTNLDNAVNYATTQSTLRGTIWWTRTQEFLKKLEVTVK